MKFFSFAQTKKNYSVQKAKLKFRDDFVIEIHAQHWTVRTFAPRIAYRRYKQHRAQMARAKHFDAFRRALWSARMLIQCSGFKTKRFFRS